jgi:23S rRNA (pseudouridine1915-N3)-methyltransferase
MRLHIIAVGRLRSGPELSLISDYLDRFDKTGRGMGLGPVSVVEVEDKRGGGMAAEAELLRKAVPKGAVKMILDERGKVLSSIDFSDQIAGWRDAGQQDLAILIGGADGLAPELRQEADFAVSFGKMVWPHMLVRVMLSEQLYRAASILGNAPYHRV